MWATIYGKESRNLCFEPMGGGSLHRLMLENAEKLDLLNTKCFINKYDYKFVTVYR